MAKVYEFDRTGGPDVLRIVDRDVREPGPGEVRLAMRATGINRAELLFAAGRYLVEPALPGSPIGLEGAGTVDALGDGVDGFSVGDRVAVLPAFSPREHGVLAERAVVPAAALVRMPDAQAFDEAAAFWMAYGTAWGMLVEAGGLTEGGGQRVVITAAASAIGLAALQVAKAHGAIVIATTRDPVRGEALEAAGADRVVVTGVNDDAGRLRAASGGDGFDIACDAVAGSLLAPLSEAAAPGATIVAMGVMSGEVPPLPLYPMLAKGLTLTGFHLGFRVLAHPERRDRMIDDLVAGRERSLWRAAIDSRFAFDDAPSAYERMASGEHVGKIVVEIGA